MARNAKQIRDEAIARADAAKAVHEDPDASIDDRLIAWGRYEALNSICAWIEAGDRRRYKVEPDSLLELEARGR